MSTNTKSRNNTNAAPIPLFLLKLVDLLENSDYNQYVQWSESGKSFIVLNQAEFSKYVLPKYFKHDKFTSFVRQLNLYGFRKISPLNCGLFQQEEQVEFKQPFFIRGNVDMLPLIKRKVKVSSQNSKQAEDNAAVLDEVTEIKDYQSELTCTFSDIKQENEDIWNEVVFLQQKHAQLQKAVNHLITCLDGEQHHEKSRKRSLLIEYKDNDSNVIASKVSKPVIFNDTVPSTSSTMQDIDVVNNNPTTKDGLVLTELPSTSTSPSTAVEVSQDPLNGAFDIT